MPIFSLQLLRPANLTNLILPALKSKPDEVALVSGSQVWTWRELQRDIDALALGLIAMGLGKGDRVASLMPNCGEILILYLACLKVGLVVVPLNYRYTPLEIDYALELSDAAVLIVSIERCEDIRLCKRVNDLKKGIVTFGDKIVNKRSFENLLYTDGQVVDVPLVDLNDSAFIFFTTGSTGKPKGVTHSQLSFGVNVASAAATFALSQEDIILPGSSLVHVMSLSPALAGLSLGAMVVVPNDFEGREILSLLRRYRPTILIMIPTPFISMVRDSSARCDDFISLRMCITGGDKLPVSLTDEFDHKTGLLIQEVYGLTEAPDCLFNQSLSSTKIGSIGTVSPGYSASLRDDKGREVPIGEDGNLWLRGVPMMTGYWRNLQATEEVFDGDWFDTGDIMRVDSEGYFWFCGRKKQIIVHDGSNLSPQEIECAIMAHPFVDLAGVVGVPDDIHGENVWAYIKLKKGVSVTSVRDVADFAIARIGYKAPIVIKILDDLPMSPIGKVDRIALRQIAEEHVGRERN
ncbi:acyl--CoA ligase [Microbulbifer sp. OS29]|uniref:Acyl--CoA ligase n=1 Tax=Microbulbifer okhotskensis TaxID=2926617 RepID=A0A9X2EQK7_9GAMM|nr:class I adenylate-forming enzyme family protein [Microbulbifer okhotskensis]MCO1336557.1 acyl--CoA ligase [Microbulbifer okhotskensis]